MSRHKVITGEALLELFRSASEEAKRDFAMEVVFDLTWPIGRLCQLWFSEKFWLLTQIDPCQSDDVEAWVDRHVRELLGKLYDAMAVDSTSSRFEFVGKITEMALCKEWAKLLEAENRRRSRPVRNADRDATIVRLHDKERISFGAIGRRLIHLNPAWSGKNGAPLSRAAVEKAYHRHK